MQKYATGGSVIVQVRPAVGGLPSATVLGQTTVSSFPSTINWQDIIFINVTGLSPYAGICVVVISASGNAACTLQYCNNAAGNGGYLSSADGGNTWTQNTGNDFQFNLFGQVNTPGNSSSTSYYLNDVRLKAADQYEQPKPNRDDYQDIQPAAGAASVTTDVQNHQ